MKPERRLILRRKSNDTVKATICIPKPTTVAIWHAAKRLARVFGEKRYCFDVTEFKEFYKKGNKNA